MFTDSVYSGSERVNLDPGFFLDRLHDVRVRTEVVKGKI